MTPLTGIRPTLVPGLQQISFLEKPEAGATAAPGGGKPVSFGDTLSQMVCEVNTKQLSAADSAGRLMAGENVPLHQTMIQVEEARVAFQLMVEVRNKMLESYQELMRMQV